MRAVIGSWLAACLAGCAGSAGPAPAAAEASAPLRACQHTLEPGSSPPTQIAPAEPAVAPPSRLIVEAQLPLARLTSELEQAVPARLAEASDLRIGPAGVVRYSVDRGAFSISAVGDQLLIEAPLHGSAEACSGRRCYATCEPVALARAEIPLWLRPDYRFDRARVSLSFTRGCKVRALGGLLSVDVTPLLRSALAPRLERVRNEIDRRLPDLRAHVQRAWRQLAAPRSLPLLGCVVIDPLGLVQGPMLEARGTLHARFALLARPELRSACSEVSAAPPPLPPLAADPALPPEDVLTLGMEVPLDRLARALEAEPAGAAPRVRVARAAVTAQGRAVAAELELSGELCGSLWLQAEPAFTGEGGVISLGAARLDPDESARVRAAGADPAALARQLAERPQLAPPLPLSVLRAAPTALATLFSNPELTLSPQLSTLRAAGAAARGEQLVAWVEARGKLLLEPLPHEPP